jgi:hypothetical protein
MLISACPAFRDGRLILRRRGKAAPRRAGLLKVRQAVDIIHLILMAMERRLRGLVAREQNPISRGVFEQLEAKLPIREN